jgi:hypothetical protein
MRILAEIRLYSLPNIAAKAIKIAGARAILRGIVRLTRKIKQICAPAIRKSHWKTDRSEEKLTTLKLKKPKASNLRSPIPHPKTNKSERGIMVKMMAGDARPVRM